MEYFGVLILVYNVFSVLLLHKTKLGVDLGLDAEIDTIFTVADFYLSAF